MTQTLEMIPCPKCGDDFPKLRRELYNYFTCVNCSTTKAVVGITTVEGTGDHTYNDLIIMDQDRALAIQRAADEAVGKKTTPIGVEIIDFDNETPEAEVSQSIKDHTKSLLEGEVDHQEIIDENNPTTKIKGIDY